MKNLLLLLFFTIAVSQTIFSQGLISGNIVNKGKPVEFATVTIANNSDSTKILFYEASDSLGKFSFSNLAFGTYLVKIKLVGFQSLSKNVTISKENKEYHLYNLILNEDQSELNKVIVVAQKKMIEKTAEGFVVNTANNITQLGGTATDVLKSTPTVTVDNDGVITLRGKTPLILINGRNSGIANTDQIAASSIESIEIINNASSKYDANAESGIINIKLKKNKQAGTNGALALGGGVGAKGRVNSSLF